MQLHRLHLRAAQRRREWPTRVVLSNSQPQVSLPLALRLLRRWRWLQRIPVYLVGIGVRPEHVQVPAAP